VENKKPPAAGRGRPKGSRNKVQAAVKDMIAQALDQAGGIDYLVVQSRENPTAFMSLVGRIIPTQNDVNLAGKMVAEVRHRIIDGSAN
jgi:hypothetical protein